MHVAFVKNMHIAIDDGQAAKPFNQARLINKKKSKNVHITTFCYQAARTIKKHAHKYASTCAKQLSVARPAKTSKKHMHAT